MASNGQTPCPPYGTATRIGEGLIIRGKHRILVGKTGCKNEPECDRIGGERLARSVMDESFAEPLVFVGSNPSSEEIPFRTKSFSGVKEPLPNNVMLITKRLLYKTKTMEYLVRLGHQYGERVDVDLSSLFPDEHIEEIRETTLSGNRDLEKWKKERLDWTGSGIPKSTKKPLRQERDLLNHVSSTTISLKAMEIRTFIVKVKYI